MHTFRAYPKHQLPKNKGRGLMAKIIANAVRASTPPLVFFARSEVPHAILLFNGLMAVRHLLHSLLFGQVHDSSLHRF